MSDTKTVGALLALMHEFKVKRLKVEGVELELHESAFDAPRPSGSPEAKVDPYKPDLCVCGHDLLAEHSKEGCLHGCSVASCTAKLDKAPAA